MHAFAVIGASYGDEGKGRTVEWLAAPHGCDALVVRSNGGAQAAHTVVREDGARHVFHQIGSGALQRARTHLSRFIVSHPILLAEELAALAKLGVDPLITADPRGAVTTPWDMMVNQAVETARGGARHGSCGLGFGETVGRNEIEDYVLTVGDLAKADLLDRLRKLRDCWLVLRLEELGLDCSEGPLEFAWSDDLLDRFLAQCRVFASRVSMRADAEIGTECVVIFEGAQGLLLDQHAPGFPYLTRSNTGMANIAAIAAEAGISSVDKVYATRCYLTRHGRGPMEDERDIADWYAVVDPTNLPNPWQESLRFGLLDPAQLGERVQTDVTAACLAGNTSLAVSCLDQARGRFAWLDDGKVVEGDQSDFIAALAEKAQLSVTAEFSSPVNDLAGIKIQNTFSKAG